MKKRVLTAAIAAMCFVGTAPVSAVPITGVAENLQEQTVLTENNDAVTTTIAVTGTQPVTTITMPVLDDPTIQTEVVTVTVMDVSGDNILVKPVDSSPELNSSDKFYLSSKKLPDDIKPKVGMKLEITYKGGILVTFPGQFANVQNVVVVKEDTVKEDPTLLKGTKDMTLNDVMRLAELGDELDWADFKDYKGRDVGSGLYIWEYKLEGGFVLDVGGDIQKKPIYILLSHDNDKGIDIRTEDVKEYIASTVTPVVDDPSIMTSDYTMTVTVIEINGSSLLVKNVESSGDVLTLPANKLDNGIKPVVGMKLEVTYNGGILEDYPAMFGNIQKVTVLSETTEIVAGDANCDGSVDMADAVMIMQALANPNKYGINGTAEHHLTEQGKLNGDMDGDGLTVGDAQAIQRKLLGLDSESSEIEPELGDIVSIKTPYRPAMSDWSGIGILLEFDSSDYQITLFAEDGHFTYWDINKGSGPIKDVGTTYEVGKNGYIFWTPDDFNYPEDFETEIIVKGTSSNKSVELGRIYVTRGERSTLIASLGKPDSAIDPMQPEIQPLGVGGIDEAITLISNYDLNNYDKVYHDSYKKMFERFKNDGFIYQVTENETIKENNNRGVALFPYAKYEDIGVGYYVTFKEKNYHIMFYYADAEVLTETEGIAEYLKKRMGRSSDKIVKIQDKDVSLLFPENGQCYANAFIDENHYFDIIGAVSEDELIEFLNAFEYGKLNLKSDKRLKLIDNTIKSVNVTSLPKGYDFTFTDSKAQKFIDFLSDMELTDDFSEDPGQLNGMTWVIKLEYQNNETMTLYDIGGYIRSENDSWLKYEYDYDSPLDTLIWELSK